VFSEISAGTSQKSFACLPVWQACLLG